MEEVEEQNSSVNKENIRLNKFIAQGGVASRRKADELIAEGRVQINGRVVKELGTAVNPARDKVYVDGERIIPSETFVYYLLNKPKDTITTVSDERGRRTVMDLLPARRRCFPVGRLDRNTTGVLLITDDGELAHRMMHPRYKVAKSYVLRLDQGLEESDRKALLRGVVIDGKPAKALEVVILGNSRRREVGILLHEGRNRQIRKMVEFLGYKAQALDRVEYAGLTATGLRRGEWRKLSRAEIRRLREMTGIG